MMFRDLQTGMRAALPIAAGTAILAAWACGEVGSGPNAPAAIELKPLAAVAAVIGDSLRDVNGVALPIKAIVRNLKGDILPDAPVRYIYADATRDTAIFVDSITGYIVALKALNVATPTARIAARIGNSLQIVRSVSVTVRPDSADRGVFSTVDTLRVTQPDAAVTAAANTSASLGIFVRHTGDNIAVVPNWLVKYEVILPANPSNDSTRSVYLVDESQRVSNIDTTDAGGSAARYVRVRANTFPATAAPDSAVVLVTVSYRGRNVKGAPIRIVVPVKQKAKS